MGPLTQRAPYPEALATVVAAASYKGWNLYLDDVDRDGTGPYVGQGLTLAVFAQVPDTYTGRSMGFLHYFPVPPYDYDQRAWTRWVFDRLVQIETHEAMEAFKIGDRRPFAPSHAPGSDPYTIRELATEQDQSADYRGVVHA